MSLPSAPDDGAIHVVHVIVSLGSGGAETALLRLIQGSVGLGFKHTIVSLAPGGVLTDYIRRAGAEVLELPSGSVPRRLWALLKLSGRRLGKPDVIQGWMVHGNFVAWMLRAFRHRRARLAWNLRMTLANTPHEKGRTIWITRRLALLSRAVDLLIANSEASMSDHLTIGYRPRRSLVIPNGFDSEIFVEDAADRTQIRGRWSVPSDAVVFGLVGRFHRTKGHGIFIGAAADVLAKYPDTRFVLAGKDTDSSPVLDGLLADRGIADAFIRLGGRADIPSIMRALDVVCVPSDYESFPNVLGEAMMSARPAIATNVSDVATIMGGIGQIIPVGDEKALAAAMRAMIDAGPQGRAATGEAGRRRMITYYSLDSVVGRYVEQYRLLSDGGHGPA